MTGAYAATRAGAAFMVRSDRVRMEFAGAKPAETLNGIFTNDIGLLRPGGGLYAAALTNKGKVVADVRVFAREDGFVVDTSAAAGPAFISMIRKYVNPRLATYRDVTTVIGTIGVFGPTAAHTAGTAVGLAAEQLDALQPYGHLSLPPRTGFVARVPDLGVVGFDIFAPTDEIDEIRARLQGAGSGQLSPEDAHTLRVEAGRPLYGADMDENVLAQEAALDRDDLAAISFNKGCYTGQETVARVHFRGHVNRTLRGLRAESTLPTGATLHDPDGAQVGEVRSVAQSPRFGAIALAYVRRELADGSRLTARTPRGELPATVTPLPFV
ncbi:MAG: glycine cleavage T C-terminal barrel domain-containing protein [Gemmatimonadota bacterium]|nr:glycine cleavage T C-terminal barrel domain-containing protein [Gemmatimonadota bacterium]